MLRWFPINDLQWQTRITSKANLRLLGIDVSQGYHGSLDEWLTIVTTNVSGVFL